MTQQIRTLVAALAAILLMASAASAQDEAATGLDAFGPLAERTEAALDADTIPGEEIEERRAVLETARQGFVGLAAEAAAELAPLQTQLEALGPAPEDGGEEAPELAAERSRLSGLIADVTARQRRAEQSAARAAALTEKLNALRRARFEAQLLTRGPSPLDPSRFTTAWKGLERQGRAVVLEIEQRFRVAGALGTLVDRLALPALISLLAVFVVLWGRRRLVAGLSRQITTETGRIQRVRTAIGITIARLLLPALAVIVLLTGVHFSGILGPTGIVVVTGLGQAALLVIGAFALGNAFYSPDKPGLRLSGLEDPDARRSYRWLLVVALVVALDHACVGAGREIGLNLDALALLNAGLLVLGGLALWRYVGAAHVDEAGAAAVEDTPDDPPDPEAQGLGVERSFARLASVIARAVAIIAPLLALAGYYGASRFLFYPVVFSAALIGLCILIYRTVSEVSASLGETGTSKPDETASPVLPVLAGFVLVVLAAPVLALIWGATLTDLETFWARLVEGFQIGEVVISPVDFVLFVIVFVIGYLLTRVLQGVLRRSVLPVLRMDTGAKSALNAGVGYVGIIIAALVAISTTGLDLSNLAIVAGALSVGIGFGLQNIVNNFVSGIILLVERPIKTGDWVEIGGVHGTVQKVNVRSTEIQTFDRSTMFVPNADLISGTVTNWTHGNSNGRLIVQVGVAYGSDVRKIEKILLEIAQAHPMLMRRPGPYIVFTGFGADSLDFEIRGVLRDVNWILNVASDIRFSVYERFEAEGIEIPFAQRDVHIRSLGGLEKYLVQRPEDGGEDAPSDPVDDSGGDGAPDGPG